MVSSDKIDVTKLNQFYGQFINNLKQESVYEDIVRDCQSSQEFIEKLKERAITMNHLYIENEGLFDVYLRPLLNKEQPLDEETAEVLFKNAIEFCKNGREDFIAGISVLKLLEEYYYEKNDVEKRVICLIVLARYYNQLTDDEYYHLSIEYFDKLYEYKDKFYTFKDKDLQNLYRKALISRGIGMGNCPFVSMEQILVELDNELEFMEETSEWEIVDDKDNYSANARHLIIMTIFAKILGIDTITPGSKAYQKALEYIETYYEEERSKTNNIFDVSAPVFISYHKLCWLLGIIPTETLFDRYFKYYMNNSLPIEEDEGIDDIKYFLQSQRYYAVMNLIPDMFMILRHCKEVDTPYQIECQQLMYDFICFIRTIRYSGKESFLCENIYYDLLEILPMIKSDKQAYDLVYQVFISRDIDSMIHSLMVAKLSERIIELVYDNNPELLIGCLDCINVESVLNKKAEIIDYLKKGSVLHDIGKICLNFITKKQTRRLDERERSDILKHPEIGAELANKAYCLRKYIPLIMGHHRFYDDTTGYPKSYRYKNQPNAFLVNVLQLSDCLDAATDSIGRSYSKTKSVLEVLNEFKEGSGYRYNDKIIDLMLKDKNFQSDIEEICTKGRIEVVIDIYENI